MTLFGRRNEPVSIETEQERLRAIRIAAEQELGRLRRELTERVAAVEARERELADALARSSRRAASPSEAAALEHAKVGLAAQAQEYTRREKELEAREAALLKMEADFARRAAAASETPEERLAQIEERLAALQEAEKAFARTRAELAARSEALASREAELHDRELAAPSPTSSVIPNRAELIELDERLRRLERETREASTPRGFGDDLRTLERKGLRGLPPNQ